jgi:hypothetical protein
MEERKHIIQRKHWEVELHTFKKEFDEEHFAVIEFNIKVIEVLQLNGSEHIRVCIDLNNNKNSWLVP